MSAHLHTTEEEEEEEEGGEAVEGNEENEEEGGGEGESMLKRMPNICTKEKVERRARSKEQEGES
jgi:hypothetical protein